LPREYTIKHYLEKAAAYCAYQERSEHDVYQRLQKWDLKEEEIQKILHKLKEEQFFNDVRFAEAFARGKHRQNKWGRYKIIQGLYSHGITGDVAENAIANIPPEEYVETLRKLLESKIRLNKAPNVQEKARVFNYLRSKGYETDLIYQTWDETLQ
jgi:regulatory protein